MERQIRLKESENLTLEFFCKQNASQISCCGWIDTKYCQKSCKYYLQRDEKKSDERRNS